MSDPAQDGPGRVTLMAVAHPWHCDIMGHMNTRHYAAFFDDASFQLLEYLAQGGARHLGWADVRHEFDFRSETPAGAPMTVTSHLVRLGTSSITYRHVMCHSVLGTLLAEAVVTTVRFDLDRRASVPIEPAVRARAAAL